MGCSASQTSRFSKCRAASYSEEQEKGDNSNKRPTSNSSSKSSSNSNEANVDVGVMYASSGAHVWDSRPDTGNLVQMAMVDSAQTAMAVGGEDLVYSTFY